MSYFQKFVVRQHERGLLFKDGDFIEFLEPGTYRYTSVRADYAVECFDISEGVFDHPLAEYLYVAHLPELIAQVHIVETGATEVAVIYRNQDVLHVLGPGERQFYWKGFADIRAERYPLHYGLALTGELDAAMAVKHRPQVERYFRVVQTAPGEVAVIYRDNAVIAVLGPGERVLYLKDIADLRVEHYAFKESLALSEDLALRLVNARDGRVLAIAADAVYACIVPESHVGLLYVNGELTDTLPPGLHAYWNASHAVNIDVVDLRVRVLEVRGQEILTRDKVAVRINVSATYQYVDAAKAKRAAEDPLDRLYKEIQFGLRAAVGTRKLDALLEDKTAIDRDIAEFLGARFVDVGIGVASVGVKDIILPGDMKLLLAKVVEAEKAAEANVIRRREETNATRSLLNTAKVMESNGVALRLKELEILEKVTGNVGTLSVVGGLDALLDGLVHIKP